MWRALDSSSEPEDEELTAISVDPATAAVERSQTATGSFRRSNHQELCDHLRHGGTVDIQEECFRFERQLLEAVLESHRR